MIYLDTSVALAHLLGETRAPAPTLWDEQLVASRLLEYELWVRIHARRITRTHGDAVRSLLATVTLIEMSPGVLSRATEPFPVAVRTLDAIHLASMIYLREHGQQLALACYDDRLTAAARAVGVEIAAV